MRKKMRLLVVLVLLLTNLVYVTVSTQKAMASDITDQDVIDKALQIELFSSEADCREIIDSFTSLLPDFKGSFRDNSFLYIDYLPESSQQFLVTGLFNDQAYLIRYQLSWAAVSNKEAEERKSQLEGHLISLYGDSFRSLQNITYRESSESKYENVLTLNSWKTKQNETDVFVHLILKETINVDSKTLNLIFTQADFNLDLESSNWDADMVLIETGKSTAFKHMEGSPSLFFYLRDAEISALSAVTLYLDATILFDDFSTSPLASTNFEAYFLIDHTMGMSLYMFDQIEGLLEIRYTSGIESIEIINQGHYGDALMKVLSLKNDDKISDYIKIEKDVFTKALYDFVSR